MADLRRFGVTRRCEGDRPAGDGLSLALSRRTAFQAVHQARAATYVTLVQITFTGPIGL
jgi:hypothetical protein